MSDSNDVNKLNEQAAQIAKQLHDPEIGVITLSYLAPTLIEPVVAFSAINLARETNQSVGKVLSETIGITTTLRILGQALNYPVVDLLDADAAWVVDEDIIERLNLSQLMNASALPVRDSSGQLYVALANPLAHPDILDHVSAVTGTAVKPALGSGEQIQARLVFLDTPDISGINLDQPDSVTDRPSLQVAASPVIDWLNNMLARAHADRVSDVHLSFRANQALRLRWRVDGHLVEQPMPLKGREQEVIRSILARCSTIDSSDLRRPQDGAFSFAVAGGRRIDARLSMMPQINGPTVVIRLLDPANVQRTLDKMGFSTYALEAMRRAIETSQGMVFVVGPTGSGKSTTLYGMLYEMDTDTRNVLTAEDPVEYRMPSIGQTEIRGDLAGNRSLTFVKALRGFLRLDPDVILVGEVRDTETAKVALHAALTGHLLLSTIHANSALGVFQRLTEMGVEPYLTAEALTLAVSQRLLRKLHTCALEDAPTLSEIEFLTQHKLPTPATVRSPRPGGCTTCRGSGFYGRIPVVEVLEPSRELRDIISAKGTVPEMIRAARLGGWRPLLEDAYEHVELGNVPISEMARCLDGTIEE